MTYDTKTALARFLGRICARTRLGDEERQAILNLPGHFASVENNQDLVRLGEVVDQTCLVAEGMMGRFGQTLDGLRQITALYIPGDMPDLHSFVIPRSNWALMSLTRSIVLRVPHSAIRGLTERYPSLTQAFWRDCTLDAATSAEWILNIGRRDARGRLAHLLCEMATRYEQIGEFDGLKFPLPLTQYHLADALGLTSVHVNRMIRSLRDLSIVKISKNMVEVLDWATLVRIAEYNPSYLALK